MTQPFDDLSAAQAEGHAESSEPAEPTDQQPEGSGASGRAGAFEPSRSPGVQRVLEDLEGLDQRPVGEHAAAYQDAHERLTRELETAESRIAGAGGQS